MHKEAAGVARYQLIVRGELGDRFAFLFEGMQIERREGMTVLTGDLVDQAHLLGLIQRIQELGLELRSVEREDLAATERRTTSAMNLDEGSRS
jgi:hypothetical protein